MTCHIKRTDCLSVSDILFLDKVTHGPCLAAQGFFCWLFGVMPLLHLSTGSSLWPGVCLWGWRFEAHSWKRLPELSCCSCSYPGSRTYSFKNRGWSVLSLWNMQERKRDREREAAKRKQCFYCLWASFYQAFESAQGLGCWGILRVSNLHSASPADQEWLRCLFCFCLPPNTRKKSILISLP